ncbi:MAG: hypothetical protein ACRCYT_02690 [Cetobacterium sp.]
MKNIILSILDTIINFSILLGSFWISEKYNFINRISFIPNDKKIEVSVSLYTLILLGFYNFIKRNINQKKVNLKLISYEKKQNPDIMSNPTFKFSNKYNVSEIYIDIHMNGDLKKLNKMILVLNFPNWVQPQLNLGFEENGSFKIKFKDIIGMSIKKGKLEKILTLKIPMICIPESFSQEDSIVFNIDGQPWFLCTIEKNSFKLKNKQ